MGIKKERSCPNGCGFYANDGSDGRNEMNAHLDIDCKHTPTPWAVGRKCESLVTSGIEIVADCQSTGELPREISVANAAFIVRAVNAHEELIKMIKNLRDLALDADVIDNVHVEEIDFILSKAEGK